MGTAHDLSKGYLASHPHQEQFRCLLTGKNCEGEAAKMEERRLHGLVGGSYQAN